MGYARYDTPMGLAGYAVADTCHAPDCDVDIDRGLAHLCDDWDELNGPHTARPNRATRRGNVNERRAYLKRRGRRAL
jgi:hypothetical protein